MVDRSVRYRKQIEFGGGSSEPVSVDEGIARLKKMATVDADRKYKNGKKRKKIDQTIEVVMHLGIDARQADQMLRGAISLPKGIGKSRVVIAFCDGDMAEAAKEAGADIFYVLHRRLFEAFFTEGQNIGDEAVLTGLALESGVPQALLERAWSDDSYEKRLQQYLAAAHELDVRATPTIFFGEKQRLDGALPLSTFRKLAQAGAAAQQT